MDNTGGDLTHAAQEVEKGTVEQTSQEKSDERSSENGLVGEKQDPDIASSHSSSQDDPSLQKADSRIIKVEEVKEGEEAFAHLPPKEREIVKRQLDIPPVTVTYKTLYRYATRNDLIIVFVSSICAIAGGAVMPLMTVCAKT